MFEEWWKAGARQVFLRPNDLCAGMPFTRGLERLIYDKFQASRKFRIFGTDYDGSCGVRNIDLEYYIVARMIHAPDRSFEELENEYYSAYGAAAPEVRQYYQFWRKIGEGIPGKVAAELKKQNRFLNDAGQIGMVVNENIAHFYREQDFLQADAVLQKAQQRMLSTPARRLLDELILTGTLCSPGTLSGKPTGKPPEKRTVWNRQPVTWSHSGCGIAIASIGNGLSCLPVCARKKSIGRMWSGIVKKF